MTLARKYSKHDIGQKIFIRAPAVSKNATSEQAKLDIKK